MMLGKSRVVLEASRKVAANVPQDFRENHWALYQTFLSMPLYSMVRFGQWERILSEPQPPEKLGFWRGISHYARGLAYVYTGKQNRARIEGGELKKVLADPSTPKEMVGFANAERLLTLALAILEGELAAKNGDFPAVLAHLEGAVELQDKLTYTEPPDWYFAVRHSLGAVLLEAGKPEQAEAVYRQDLKRYPENGYSLFGLRECLRVQGRAEAAEIEERFRKAWFQADVELSSSRF